MSAYTSAFELFSIGIGPSSSHTVGPMKAAVDFVTRLRGDGALDRVASVSCALYGSLGATGIGHGTPDAVVAGLQGLDPETVDPDAVRRAWSDWPEGRMLELAGSREISFAKADITLEPRTRLPGHPNAMTLVARDADGAVIADDTYYSIGGGFIRRDGEPPRVASAPMPLAFDDAATLIALCDEHGITIAEAARLNEAALRSDEEIAAGLDRIWDAMAACVNAGLENDGVLPGILKVKRRAAVIRGQLDAIAAEGHRGLPGEWLGAFALAVNQEKAAGGWRGAVPALAGAGGGVSRHARYM